jgi:hypothetical protein
MRIGARTFGRTIVVRPDLRANYSQAQYEARYRLATMLLDDLTRLDVALNALSKVDRAAPASPAGEQARALIDSITSNPANDQDDDFLADRLRERLQSLLGTFDGSFAPPTAAQQREAAALDALVRERVLAFAAWDARLSQGSSR